MSEINMFEMATKMKFRFNSAKGNLTIEDLWDLPLTSNVGVSLDSIAKMLNKEVKENAEESFVVKKKKANAVAELKFNITLHIIGVRLAEIKARENAIVAKAEKNKLAGIIVEMEDDKLRGKGLSKLKKMHSKL